MKILLLDRYVIISRRNECSDISNAKMKQDISARVRE